MWMRFGMLKQDNFIRWAAALLAILAFAVGGQAALAQLPQPGEQVVETQLLPEGEATPGKTVTLALVMKPKPGWHGYWQNPGDAGAGTRIKWNLPQGLSAGPLLYPVPQRLMISGLMNYVYKGEHALLIDVKVAADVKTNTRLPVEATVEYLACTSEICLPQSAKVGTELVVNSGPAAANPVFDRYREALPKPLSSPAHFERVGDRFRMAVPVPESLEFTDPYFFPATERVISYTEPQKISRNGDHLIIETAAAGSEANLVEGVLKVRDGLALSLTASPGLVPAAGEQVLAAENRQADWRPILLAFAGALLGGILLNIMPCVFPILSLKALSLARAGGGEHAARRDALAYAAGSVLMALALGGLLLALRAGGAAVGWAFQLQDPRVVTFLLLLMIVMALNLAGLFELPTIAGGGKLARGSGASGSFWTGALAAFVGTPCTGPFMAAALGAALVLPTAAALAIFGGLGFGLALPFLLLGFVPALRRRLPRPGPWMARFRRLMAVPLILTALWLGWVLARQAGPGALLLGVSAGVAVSIALWSFGQRQSRGRSWVPLVPGAAAAAAAVLFIPVASIPTAATASPALSGEPFSEARLSTLRAEGRPVFVYFTADWCISCKVNEKGVLERDTVMRSFQEKDIAVLVGDWTQGDAEIARFLEKHGRSGIPLYLYYPSGQPAQALPQLLTTDRLLSLEA